MAFNTRYFTRGKFTQYRASDIAVCCYLKSTFELLVILLMIGIFMIGLQILSVTQLKLQPVHVHLNRESSKSNHHHTRRGSTSKAENLTSIMMKTETGKFDNVTFSKAMKMKNISLVNIKNYNNLNGSLSFNNSLEDHGQNNVLGNTTDTIVDTNLNTSKINQSDITLSISTNISIIHQNKTQVSSNQSENQDPLTNDMDILNNYKPQELPDTNETEPYAKNISVKFIESSALRRLPNEKRLVRGSQLSGNIPKPKRRKVALGPKRNVDTDNVNYLEETKNFTHPLDINMTFYVNRKIKSGKDIPFKPVNPHPFQYLHKAAKCTFTKSGRKNIVILVKSSVHHFTMRKTLRKIWRQQNPTNIVVAFLLGYSHRYAHLVKSESQTYHDIIQENFVDSYINNTYKTIMAFNWATKYCSGYSTGVGSRGADFIVFIDDDFYVLYNELAHYLQTLPSKNVLAGALVVDPIPYRDKFYKWYVSRSDYAPNYYPDYLSGGIFVVSRDVLEKFHHTFPYVKYIVVDDAYLGIVAHKLSITPKHDFHFQGESNAAFAVQCSHNPKELLKKSCDLAQGRLFNKEKSASKTISNSKPESEKLRFSLHLLFIMSLISFLILYYNLDLHVKKCMK